MKKVVINNLLIKVQFKIYIFNIIKKYIILLKNKNYKNLILFFVETNYKLNLISFIIIISSKKSNIFVHLLDCLGKELFFYSIGSSGLTKKYNKEIDILQNYLKIIINKFKILKNKPLILHTLNINFNLNWLLEKLTQKLIVISAKQFINLSYNGCRKKKL